MTQRIIPLIALLLLAAARVAHAHEPLRIPAAGIVDLEEFTIEMWIMLGFTPDHPNDNQIARGMIYELKYADPAFPGDVLHTFMFTQYTPREKITSVRTYTQVYANGDRVPTSRLGDFLVNPTKGSWHHFAVTYKGRTRRIICDGEPGLEELAGPFAHVLREKSELWLGTNGQQPSHFALDEIRISSIARDPKEIGFHSREPMKPDRHTTLLINFDDMTDSAQWRPALAATSAAGQTRPLPQGARVVDGKFGKAMAFFMEP